MGIRETINKNPQVVTSITLVMIGAALLGMGWQLVCDRVPEEMVGDQAYYTVDDGKTLFVDSGQRIPPFEVNGQQAVRAMVYTCDGGRSRFVGYLQRYSQQTLDALAAMPTTAEATDRKSDYRKFAILSQGVEAKRPGEEQWIPLAMDERFQAVMNVACPDGTTKDLKAMVPPDRPK